MIKSGFGAGLLALGALASAGFDTVDDPPPVASEATEQAQVTFSDTGGASPDDILRLRAYEPLRAALFEQLPQIASNADQKAAAETELLLGLPGAPVTYAGAITGQWRCRVAKLDTREDALLGYVRYGWFRCTVALGERAGEYRIEKVSGSQRFVGVMRPRSDGAFTYTGVGYVNNDKPSAAYPTATENDQVGVFTWLGTRGARLEMPLPHLESQYDVLELRR
jgi:hypothetical protein